MPWATFQQGDKYCVFKLDADNNKTGETLGCHPSRAEAQRQVAALYAAEKKTEKELDELIESLKAGRRNASKDQDRIQKIHDLTCELDANCKTPEHSAPFDSTDKLAIFKQADGKFRWLTFSSSAFRDRDKEIVSTKALENDVERADKDGKFGPLRFWHEPGVDLGEADFNAMEGRVLVESGTFADERIGERLKAYADELGVSIGFTHPPDEPDKDGTYHTIRRFERSLVPRHLASNLLTQFVVKESDMETEKKSLLVKLIGQDLADKFIGKAQETQKAAEDSGLKFKQTETTIETKAEDKPAEDEKKPDFLTAEDAKELINKAFAEYDAKVAAAKKESEEATTKAASDIATTLKAIQDGQVELKEAVTMALSGVAELKGELPRRITDPRQFYRPSQDGAQPNAEATKSYTGPQNDPLAPFMQAVLNSQSQQFVAPNAPQGN